MRQKRQKASRKGSKGASPSSREDESAFSRVRSSSISPKQQVHQRDGMRCLYEATYDGPRLPWLRPSTWVSFRRSECSLLTPPGRVGRRRWLEAIDSGAAATSRRCTRHGADGAKETSTMIHEGAVDKGWSSLCCRCVLASRAPAAGRRRLAVAAACPPAPLFAFPASPTACIARALPRRLLAPCRRRRRCHSRLRLGSLIAVFRCRRRGGGGRAG